MEQEFNTPFWCQVSISDINEFLSSSTQMARIIRYRTRHVDRIQNFQEWGFQKGSDFGIFYVIRQFSDRSALGVVQVAW